MEPIERTDGLLAAFNLNPGDNVLFVHAHPDDEAMTNSELMRRLIAAGINVHIVLATDGKESTVGDQTLVRGGYRRLEAIRALLQTGVPLVNQFYFDRPDGQLDTTFETKFLEFQIGSLLLEHHFAAVFTPGEAGFDGHNDHKAVHAALLSAAKRQAPFVGNTAVWGINRQSRGVTLTVDKQNKLNALGQHATQFYGAGEVFVPPETETYLALYSDLLEQESYEQVWPPNHAETDTLVLAQTREYAILMP